MNISFELFLPKITLFYRILSPNSQYFTIKRTKSVQNYYNQKYL